MQQVVPFLSLSDSEEGIDLRSISQDTIGTLAEAVGKETFAPFVEGTIQAAVDAMLVEGEDVTPLREASFGSFAVLAKVYGEEFATYLPTVMPILLETIQKNESDKALLGELTNAQQSQRSANTLNIQARTSLTSRIKSSTRTTSQKTETSRTRTTRTLRTLTPTMVQLVTTRRCSAHPPRPPSKRSVPSTPSPRSSVTAKSLSCPTSSRSSRACSKRSSTRGTRAFASRL